MRNKWINACFIAVHILKEKFCKLRKTEKEKDVFYYKEIYFLFLFTDDYLAASYVKRLMCRWSFSQSRVPLSIPLLFFFLWLGGWRVAYRTGVIFLRFSGEWRQARAPPVVRDWCLPPLACKTQKKKKKKIK